MPRSNVEIAIELQTKFEFYLLGLIFTVLGLSIQTAEFGRSDLTDGLELIGWLLLLISALVGVMRGEWIPVVYQIRAKQESTDKRIDQITAQLEHGILAPVTFIEKGQEEQVDGATAITRLNAVLDVLESQQKEGEARILKRYQVMKWTFFAGVFFLVGSRGYLPTKALFLKFLSVVT